MEDSSSSERTPLQSPRNVLPNPVRNVKNLRDQKKEEARRVIEAQSDTRLRCFTCCICITCSVILFGSISLFIYYIISTLNKREETDHKSILISENHIDYIYTEGNSTVIKVFCSIDNPCEGWNCEYIREHFHENPDPCQYHDWLEYIVIAVCILLCCACCQALK